MHFAFALSSQPLVPGSPPAEELQEYLLPTLSLPGQGEGKEENSGLFKALEKEEGRSMWQLPAARASITNAFRGGFHLLP